MGPLQMIALVALVNIPKMPIKLGLFYKSLGIGSFEFMPNLITFLFPLEITHANAESSQLPDNAAYHPNIFAVFL